MNVERGRGVEQAQQPPRSGPIGFEPTQENLGARWDRGAGAWSLGRTLGWWGKVPLVACSRISRTPAGTLGSHSGGVPVMTEPQADAASVS